MPPSPPTAAGACGVSQHQKRNACTSNCALTSSLGPSLLAEKTHLEVLLQVLDAKADFAIREDTTHLLHGITLGTRKPQPEPLSMKGPEVKIMAERAYLQAVAV